MGNHEDFFRSLGREEVHLVALKEYLYEGSWKEIEKDLVARKEGRPHVYRLETRIDEDLERVRKLLDYETKYSVNLGDYLHLVEGLGGFSSLEGN